MDEFPKRRSPADSSAGLSDPWERDLWMLFEFLILEGAQAGLSWMTILKKRAELPEGVRWIPRREDCPVRRA